MRKSKLIFIVLLAALILALLAGCQAQNADVPTEPSASSQPTDPTEPSEDVTDLTETSQATEPTELLPLTVETVKAYLKPYMTYEEVKALWGPMHSYHANDFYQRHAYWRLDDGSIFAITFCTTETCSWEQYLELHPVSSDEEMINRMQSWIDHMAAYAAGIWVEVPGSLAWNEVEELFDYGYKWGTEE